MMPFQSSSTASASGSLSGDSSVPDTVLFNKARERVNSRAFCLSRRSPIDGLEERWNDKSSPAICPVVRVTSTRHVEMLSWNALKLLSDDITCASVNAYVHVACFFAPAQLNFTMQKLQGIESEVKFKVRSHMRL